MNRKYFLASLIATSAAIKSLGSAKPGSFSEKAAVLPPYLSSGDSIGICSPAGHITAEEIQPAVLRLKDWGFNIIIGNSIGKRDFILGGTDEERRKDLQAMMDDSAIKAILCARGGYGLIRILDKLDFSRLVKNPKWIIGFSDITYLHSHLNRKYNIASLHSKMCNSFPDVWELADSMQKETIESIRSAITGSKLRYSLKSSPFNRTGKSTGQLVGGNLKTLETLAGSMSDINTDSKILFIEDTQEKLYSIDRMMWNLKRSGKLANLKGLIVGGFKLRPDDPGDEFGKTIQEIVLEKISEYKYPVCFDFPVGHQKNNFALKCGVIHELEVNAAESFLKEI
jgi:muramoyltetrapeptide carboxypeptidase